MLDEGVVRLIRTCLVGEQRDQVLQTMSVRNLLNCLFSSDLKPRAVSVSWYFTFPSIPLSPQILTQSLAGRLTITPKCKSLHKISIRIKENASLESKLKAELGQGLERSSGPSTPKARTSQPCRQHRVNYPPALRSTKVHHCNMPNIYIASLCSLNRFWLNNEQTVLQTPMRIPKL